MRSMYIVNNSGSKWLERHYISQTIPAGDVKDSHKPQRDII